MTRNATSIPALKASIAYRISLFLALLYLSGPTVAQQIGYILEARGEWTTRSGVGRLSTGDVVMAGAMVENLKAQDLDRLVVADLNGEVVKTVMCNDHVCGECRPSGVCRDPIVPLPTAPPRIGPFAGSWQAALSLLRGNRDRYSALRVRGVELQDCVALLSPDGLDLAPMLANQPAGRYYIALSRIERDRSRSPEGSLPPMAVDWQPGSPSLAQSTRLQPGLYKATLLEEVPGGYRATINNAWILASPKDMYDRSGLAFQEMLNVSRRWETNVSTSTSRALGRAYLDRLSEIQ